jgi:EmrB/QacA subfamily drug resistance transporter
MEQRRAWIALAPLLAGTFLGTVTNNIANVPLRTIAADLDAALSHAVLVLVGFLLAFAVLMPVAGWAGDRIGRRRTYCIALTCLAAASLGAALAPSLPVLVGFRVLQGIATAAVLPTVMGMIADLFPPGRWGRALGAWAAANGLGQAVGPTLGAVVTDLLSWRWIFAPIVPLAVLAAVFTAWLVPADPPTPRPLDVPGAATLTAGATLLIAAAAAVPQPGAARSVPAMAAAGALALAGFVVISRRRADPFVPLRLIGERRFLRSGLAAFAQMFCLGATLLGVPLYLTGPGGVGTAAAGLVLFAFPATMVLLAPVAGVLTDRFGPRWVIRTGLAVIVAGQLGLAGNRSLAAILPALVVTGAGVALVQTPAALGATRSRVGQAGVGLGLYNLIRFTGSAFGAAWVAVALGSAGQFVLLFGACAAVAAVGCAGTFLTIQADGAGPDHGSGRNC